MTYIKRATLALALLLPIAAHAGCKSNDAWSGSDKTVHALGGAAVAAGVTFQTRDPWQGFFWGLGAGLLKEAIDGGTGNGTCSAQDFAVTALGAGLGAAGAKFMLTMTPDGKGVAVAYRMEIKP